MGSVTHNRLIPLGLDYRLLDSLLAPGHSRAPLKQLLTKLTADNLKRNTETSFLVHWIIGY